MGIEILPTGKFQRLPPPQLIPFLKDLPKEGTKLIEVENKGKFLYFTFENDWNLFCTYGMTGQWHTEKGPHTAFTLKFENTEIFFEDPRHFGTLIFEKGKAPLEKKLKTLGWDALQTPQPPIATIQRQLRKTKDCIADALLNQKIFAGVGVYILCETLYRAKMNPFLQAKLLDENQIKTLCESIVEVVNLSLKLQGASFSTYKNVNKENGKFKELFQVYRRQTTPEGEVVLRSELPGGRNVHWAPSIQK